MSLADRYLLYMGDDDLVRIEVAGFREVYRKFPYNEIEAIIVRPTTNHLFWTIIWSFFLVLLSIPTVSLWSELGAVGLFFNLPMLFILIVHLYLGRSCKVAMQTAVQQLEVPITRMPKARKLIRLVQERVYAAQGPWDAEMTQSYTPAVLKTGGEVVALKWHRWLYTMLAAEATLVFLSIPLASAVTVSLIILVNLGIAGAVIFAVRDRVRQRGSGLNWMTWITVGAKSFLFLALISIPSMLEFEADPFANTSYQAFEFYANQQPLESVPTMICYLILGAIWGGMAGVGLGAVSTEAKRNRELELSQPEG